MLVDNLRVLVRRRKRLNDLSTAVLFLLPSLVIFGVFTYFALGFNTYLSLTDWNFVSPTKEFVGLQNYRRLLTDRVFLQALRNTFYYAGATVLLSMVGGLALALLLRQRLAGRALFRTLVFSPYVTTVAAISLLWVWIFNPTHGLFNYLLSLIGIDGPRWLMSTTWAMPALIIMRVWQVTGYNMVIYLSGLLSISQDFYDAAQVDGAGPWQAFRNVTLPLISPTTFFLLVTSVIGALQVFDSVAVMTEGQPAGSTRVVNYYIFQLAFVMMRASYGSAIATVLFLIVMALTLVQLASARRWVHYQ